jgi:D-arabinose 1-dehydrogenase-like Zn-dependent alcohol dehydrogenase
LNAAKVTVAEGAKMVEQLRPEGWDHGPGCDGECHSSDLHLECALLLKTYWTAIVSLNGSEAGLVYATGMVRNHGTLVMTAGPPKASFSMLDLIFRQINIFGTQNGSGQDLRETIELCTKNSIESSLKLYKLEEDSLRDMVAGTHDPEWSGKAVVVI